MLPSEARRKACGAIRVTSHLPGGSSSCWSEFCPWAIGCSGVLGWLGTPLALSCCCWAVLCSTLGAQEQQGAVPADRGKGWLTGHQAAAAAAALEMSLVCCQHRESRFSCLWPGLYPQLICALARLLFKSLQGEFCALGGNYNFLQASQASTVSKFSQNNHIDFNSALLQFWCKPPCGLCVERTKATLILIKMEVDDLHSEVEMLVNGFVQKQFSCELKPAWFLWLLLMDSSREVPVGAGKGRRLRGPEPVPGRVTPFLLWLLCWVTTWG